jgi:predicted XRE-type DNA-binding protein
MTATKKHALESPPSITHSSGNVFLDLRFAIEEAENLHVRAQLMLHLRDVIHKRKLTQSQAAKLFRVTQPRISALVRGKIQAFSVDMLMAMLARAGMQVAVSIKPRAA